jgi:hypothetical protein
MAAFLFCARFVEAGSALMEARADHRSAFVNLTRNRAILCNTC